MQPIAGYNYGAKQYDRVLEVLHLTIKCALVVTATCFIVGMFFPRSAVSLFTHDEELIGLAARGFRITVLIFFIIGRQMVITNFFQSIGMANKAIFLSLSRQLIFLLPFLAILPIWFGADGVWFSMPASDLAALVVTEIMLARLKKSFRKEMENQQAEAAVPEAEIVESTETN